MQKDVISNAHAQHIISEKLKHEKQWLFITIFYWKYVNFCSKRKSCLPWRTCYPISELWSEFFKEFF